MAQQNNKLKAAVTDIFSDKKAPVFKRCGHCGPKKAQCRKKKQCLKGLL